MAHETKLTAVVIGAGAIGQQHLRVLSEMPGVDLLGAVDALAEVRSSLAERGITAFETIDHMLATAVPSLAVVSTPTDEHAAAALALMQAGVNVLIEKPIAATSEQAQALIRARDQAQVKATVGHIERFNPAVLALRSRVAAGELGEVFTITTERVGPFPQRIKDVGVAKDLATHDLDLVSWVGGSNIEGLSARSASRTGRGHEDIVMITGELGNGIPFNSVVDWLTPVKRRTLKVLGERGMLLADTVTSDLHLYENGETRSEWEVTRTLRGVTEGNVTRFALERREPLRSELEAFCEWIRSGERGNCVSLEEGAAALLGAEQAIASASRPLAQG